jgi:hypothetical protein
MRRRIHVSYEEEEDTCDFQGSHVWSPVYG